MENQKPQGARPPLPPLKTSGSAATRPTLQTRSLEEAMPAISCQRVRLRPAWEQKTLDRIGLLMEAATKGSGLERITSAAVLLINLPFEPMPALPRRRSSEGCSIAPDRYGPRQMQRARWSSAAQRGKSDSCPIPRSAARDRDRARTRARRPRGRAPPRRGTSPNGNDGEPGARSWRSSNIVPGGARAHRRSRAFGSGRI